MARVRENHPVNRSGCHPSSVRRGAFRSIGQHEGFVDTIRRRIPDARYHLENAFPREFVTRINDNSEIRHYIFDMGLFKESDPGLNTIRNVSPRKLQLQLD